MISTAGDVRRVHASFGNVDDLLDRRHAVYRLAVELAGGATELPTDVLENPAVRAHLGEVLGGVSSYDPARMQPLSDLTTAAGRRVLGGHPMRVASAPAAGTALIGALHHLDAELVRRADDGSAALVLEGSPSFAPAMRTVVCGVDLAVEIAPDLALDLLPHVALFGVLRADRAGRLGSASIREYPGLVLLPEPTQPIEVAEALVHEGAHQKFFDLAITRSILGPHATVRFTPPWSPPDTPPWPFEQCLAAFHAYCCLAVLADAVRDREIAVHPYSLLPFAAERAEILGEWLGGHGELLGMGGRAFVGALTGQDFNIPAVADQDDDLLARWSASMSSVGIRECGDWALMMSRSRPADLAWVPVRMVEALR
jgi:hypothetical protein